MAAPERPKVREAPYGYTLTLVPGAREASSAFSATLWNEAGAASLMLKELVFLRTSIVNDCPT